MQKYTAYLFLTVSTLSAQILTHYEINDSSFCPFASNSDEFFYAIEESNRIHGIRFIPLEVVRPGLLFPRLKHYKRQLAPHTQPCESLTIVDSKKPDVKIVYIRDNNGNIIPLKIDPQNPPANKDLPKTNRKNTFERMLEHLRSTESE
jgi:hypothetical protein